MDIKEILKELFKEADNGKVVIKIPKGEWQYNTQFSAYYGKEKTKSIKENAVNFFVQDFDLLAEKVNKYLNIATEFYKDDKDFFDFDDESFAKHLSFFLFVNMTNYDLNFVYNFVDSRTKFLENKIDCKETKLGHFEDGDKVGFDIFSKITKNRSNMESPYKFETILRSGDEKFILPAIHFGFDGQKVTVLGVQNLYKNQIDKLSKTLDRYFRKVNKNIDSENIESQVSPNAVVAMAIFLKVLKDNNIHEVCVKDYMPIRYYSGVECRKVKLRRNLQDENLAYEHADRDQFNMTNRLMYLALRMGVHFDNIDVNLDELKSEMNLKIKNKDCTRDENIIYKITDSVCAKNIVIKNKERNL